MLPPGSSSFADTRFPQALSRLSERESYDRAARLRAAFQYSVLHRDAPKEQWLSAEDVSDHGIDGWRGARLDGCVSGWRRCGAARG
jgi:hypothetical protein